MKNLLALAVLLNACAASATFKGRTCVQAPYVDITEAQARALISGTGVELTRSKGGSRVTWQTSAGDFSLSMHWTSTCLLILEAPKGEGGTSIQYLTADDRRIGSLTPYRSALTLTREEGSTSDRLVLTDGETVSSTSTEELLELYEGSAVTVPARSGELRVVYSGGTIGVLRPGGRIIVMNAIAFSHYQEQWRHYSLAAQGLPSLVVRHWYSEPEQAFKIDVYEVVR